MKTFILLLMLIFVGASKASDTCENPIAVCGAGGPPKIPENREELDAFCDFAINFIDCSVEHFEKCEMKERLKEVVSIKRGTQSVCNKESPLYSAFVEMLPCVTENLRRIESCHFRQDAGYSEDHYHKALHRHGLGDLTEEENHKCLYSLFDVSCTAVNAGKICGTATQSTITELAVQFFSEGDICREVAENLPLLVEILELEDKEYELLEALRKKK